MPAEFEEIDMTEAEHVAWVRAQRDPALWHQAAMAALAYRGDRHGFLHWLLEQPEMDRATAGWIFLWAEGSRYLRGKTDFPLNHISSEDMMALFRSLCARSEGRSEEHTSELQSLRHLVCRLLLDKKNQ